ncbi:hypothetical protein D1007_52375 [Hordeum vulgare]|nr:hypothetical protein D1007_52375 [Hordeum vulgare]
MSCGFGGRQDGRELGCPAHRSPELRGRAPRRPARICFRAVCRTWREAIPEEQARAMPAPWVIVPRVDGCTDSFLVLSAPTMNSFRWTPPDGARARCVGSNGSWLAIVTVVDVRSLAISLVNPLTDARVELPLITGWRWALDTEHDLEFELDVVVRKVAFSPSPSAHDYAAAYVSPCSQAVFCTRAGTHRWLPLPELVGGDREHEGVRRELDVAYHDGKFYYIATSGQVWVVDMAAAPPPSPVPLHVLSPPLDGLLTCRGYHLAFSSTPMARCMWCGAGARAMDTRRAGTSGTWP